MDAMPTVLQGDLPLDAKLDRARAELLDLSARNRLLNIPRSSNAKTVEVLDERSDEVFRILVRDGKVLTFAPGRETAGDAPADALAELPQPEDNEATDHRGVAGRHSDAKLQTRMTSKGLQKRLLDMYYDARTLEEEQGVNILFLALGTLRWTDPATPAIPRHAPLVLLPVRLERGSAGERFKLRWRGEEHLPNLSLEALLDRVHALRLPAFGSGEDFDPSAYFAAVADAVSTKPGWAVAPDDIGLGFFSFAKFLMYRDLDPDNWPAHGRLTDHPMLRALLQDGFTPLPPSLPDEGPIDPHIPPSAMLHIVDCDSSQMAAVHDVRSGRDLVIQGPPGTGKSQTIANVIASAVADGKTVLFVAEKMAALEVVKRRLDTAGVGDACLELHSSKASKRAVLDELRRTWELGAPKPGHPGGMAQRLLEARDALNAHADRMHRAHPAAGLTPYQVVGHLSRLRQDGWQPTEAVLEKPETWTPEDLRQRALLMAELVQRIQEIGQPGAHPWRGVGLDLVVPTAIERLVARIAALRDYASQAWTGQAALADALGCQAPHTLSDILPVAALARRVAAAPDLDPAALGGAAWDVQASAITALLTIGREHERLSAELAGIAAPGVQDIDPGDAAAQLSWLPQEFDAKAFGYVHALHAMLPRLLLEVDRLRADLGSQAQAHTAASVERMTATAERVAAAPNASPEAFAATVWDQGVEQAGDLADAVAVLEEVRAAIRTQVTDVAWTTDVAPARQALAERTGMLRRLSGDWRAASSLMRTVLKSPDMPLAGQLACLDSLMRGQAALRAVTAGDAFGHAAFGADWRGERSTSAPLTALVEWMRTLRGLGAEPRLIAGRLPERSAIGERSARVGRLLAEARPHLAGLWLALGDAASPALDDALSVERAELALVAARVAALAGADALCRAAIPGASALPDRLQRLAQAAAWKQAAARLSEGAALGAAAFGGMWAGPLSDWNILEAAAGWIAANADIRLLSSRLTDRGALAADAAAALAGRVRVLQDAAAVFADLQADAITLFGTPQPALPFADLLQRLQTWTETVEQLSQWVTYRIRADRARALGLGALVDGLEGSGIPPAAAVATLEMAYFEALLVDLVRIDPAFGRFDGGVHGRLVREFAELDQQRIKAASFDVATAHHRRIPPVGGGVGPLGVLRGEIARRRGHMPIRLLMQRAAPVVQALKPVLMMSPLSVAQFLTPGHLTFDLLVMDEASQIQPVDALGAIARCRQVVVVGDERQLPPTRFFSKLVAGADEDEDGEGAQVADIESILGLFTARGLPQRMLRWHYRSRHQSLIAVSNSQFYENKLFIVPSPYTGDAGMGLLFHHVPDGVFDSGGTGANAIEAGLVAQAVLRHAKAHPGMSLGVATFSVRQRQAIQDELERLRRLNPDIEEFFHAHPSEPFFVKNLENVQGDERDVILISVGYGRTAQGVMSMRFGPLSADGGERRLNVLISRAKRRCEVFASITDEDIDLERAKGRGVFAFKLFLHFARTGRLGMAPASARGPDSVFEEQVARALQERGCQVHPRVGIAGFFIDLAVADPDRPGRYVLGIEFDGPSYQGARSARDRDRLRQAVLKDHGWILHRVWSTDWFQRPQEGLDRTLAAIEAAKAELDERQAWDARHNKAVGIEIVTVDRADTVEIGLASVAGGDPALGLYAEASVTAPVSLDLHEAPLGVLADLVRQVVDVEGPVHLDEVVLRLRSAWGLQRSGGRIHAAVERAAGLAAQRGAVVRDGPFLSVAGVPVRVRDRRHAGSPTLRRPEMLPPVEIDTGIMHIITTNFGASLEEVMASVPRLLGFKATSVQLRAAVQAGVDRLRATGAVLDQEKMLVTAVGRVTEG